MTKYVYRYTSVKKKVGDLIDGSEVLYTNSDLITGDRLQDTYKVIDIMKIYDLVTYSNIYKMMLTKISEDELLCEKVFA